MTARSSKRKKAIRLVGESLREVAILVSVFVPIEFLAQGKPLTARGVGVIIATAVILSAIGIFLEVQ